MTIERNGLLWRLGFQHKDKARKPVMKELEVQEGVFVDCRTCTATLSVGQINRTVRNLECVAEGVAYCKPMDAYTRETGRQRALHHLKLTVRRGGLTNSFGHSDMSALDQFNDDAYEALRELMHAYGARPRKRAA